MALPGVITTALVAWDRMSGAARPRPDRPALWGDGIVESGLDGLWSARRWVDVADDELVFLIPALTHVQPAGPAGLAVRAGRIFSMRACAEARSLSGAMREAGSLDRLRRWQAEGLLGGSTAEEILAEGRPPGTEARTAAAPWFGMPGPGGAPAAAFARQVVIELGGLHRDAQLSPVQRPPVTSAQAMFRSIHSGLNAAYVYPSFEALHEMLAVGAWTGHLLRGRPALLPPCLAQPLAALLDDPPAGGGADPLAEVLRMHLGPAAKAHLLRAAGRVSRAGRPVSVDARLLAGRPLGAADRILALVAERS